MHVRRTNLGISTFFYERSSSYCLCHYFLLIYPEFTGCLLVAINKTFIITSITDFVNVCTIPLSLIRLIIVRVSDGASFIIAHISCRVWLMCSTRGGWREKSTASSIMDCEGDLILSHNISALVDVKAHPQVINPTLSLRRHAVVRCHESQVRIDKSPVESRVQDLGMRHVIMGSLPNIMPFKTSHSHSNSKGQLTRISFLQLGSEFWLWWIPCFITTYLILQKSMGRYCLHSLESGLNYL